MTNPLAQPEDRLRVSPISLADANEFVSSHHRHHRPVRGHKFSLSIVDSAGQVRGVAIVGRPVSRHMDNGFTLEVNRLATDGTRNACSMLYRASWRAAQAMGYQRLITYTLPQEGGASLRGAGFKCLGLNRGGSWNVPSRPRVDKSTTQQKLKWEIVSTN